MNHSIGIRNPNGALFGRVTDYLLLPGKIFLGIKDVTINKEGKIIETAPKWSSLKETSYTSRLLLQISLLFAHVPILFPTGIGWGLKKLAISIDTKSKTFQQFIETFYQYKNLAKKEKQTYLLLKESVNKIESRIENVHRKIDSLNAMRELIPHIILPLGYLQQAALYREIVQCKHQKLEQLILKKNELCSKMHSIRIKFQLWNKKLNDIAREKLGVKNEVSYFKLTPKNNLDHSY